MTTINDNDFKQLMQEIKDELIQRQEFIIDVKLSEITERYSDNDNGYDYLPYRGSVANCSEDDFIFTPNFSVDFQYDYTYDFIDGDPSEPKNEFLYIRKCIIETDTQIQETTPKQNQIFEQILIPYITPILY